jgi:hypothetical protein
MAGQLFYGSICLDDLYFQLQKKHSAFVKAITKKGPKVYVNVNIWLNDEPDQYGNSIAMQLSSKKEKAEAEGRVYIGKAKKSQPKEPEPVSNDDLSRFPPPDFSGQAPVVPAGVDPLAPPDFVDDLPF